MHTAMITIKPFSNTSSHIESTFCFLYANKNVMQPNMGLLCLHTDLGLFYVHYFFSFK